MWDPSVLWNAGQYYMFAMHNEGQGDKNMWVATSRDGVHWQDAGPVIRDAPFTVMKMFVAKLGDRFVLNHGSGRKSWNDTLRFWESRDLLQWTYLGPETDRSPDPHWYKEVGRCDHMYMIPKADGEPGKGYWGYVVATSAASWPHKSIGMMESVDGVDWKWLPPPVIDWGNVPQQYMEVGGCERIKGKYYLILGARYNYLGNGGYSVFTFVADQPRGPFRPDAEAFRLCGNSEDLARLGYGHTRGDIGTQILASFGRGKEGELLLTSYTPSEWETDKDDICLLPIKAAVVDTQGHLRMGYWAANEALKGKAIPMDLGHCERQLPAQPDRDHHVAGTGTRLELRDKKVHFRRGAGGGVLALATNRFDLGTGLVLEGRMQVIDWGWGADTHIIPVSAGFYLEEKPGQGKAILMETYGITRIDRVETRGGALTFVREDTTGPGCASQGGITEGTLHMFRLYVYRDLFELYLDDLLVQTFFISAKATGRIGFLVQDGGCAFQDVKCWAMSRE